MADVSHFVTPGSALDIEAARRGCSTYLPTRVIPMLPESLANDLCSLNPGVDRLAFTALIEVHSAEELMSVQNGPMGYICMPDAAVMCILRKMGTGMETEYRLTFHGSDGPAGFQPTRTPMSSN